MSSLESDIRPDFTTMESASTGMSHQSGVGDAAPINLEDAYGWCTKLATTHYENFTIASWLMPREMRPHMHAIYAYARIADDFADEEKSLAGLDWCERELECAYDGTASHPAFVALGETVRRYDIPRQPFLDLLTAFRSDVNFAGFESIDDLLGYARNSANPVGRLVLYLFGYRDAKRQALSDLICSGLQLANFWQDVAVDFAKGRIYFPRHDLNRFAVTPDDLREERVTSGFLELMAHETNFARGMLIRGSELHRTVDRRLSRDILMFAGGGLAIIRALEAVRFDVFRRRPSLSKFDYARIGWHALRGRLAA